MKKKILNLIIYGVLLVCITGCANNKLDDNKTNNNQNSHNESLNNNLVCSGKISLLQDFYIQKKGLDSGGIDENPENWKIGFDTSNENIETSEYTFIYNNDKLQSIKCKEIYKASVSESATDKDIQEMNEKSNIKAYKDKNNRINMEYTLDENDDIVRALNIQDNLKEKLEEHANLTCSGKSYNKKNNSNSSSSTKNEVKRDITLKCYGKVYYAYEEYNFNYKYDKSKKDYTLDSVYHDLTVPDGFNPNEFYIEEEKSNMGQYEMSLNGRIITFKLDKTRPYWDDYKYKDYSYDSLKKEYSNDGFKCE